MLLIGADMPHLHISLGANSRDKNDLIGVLTKYGWVIMAEDQQLTKIFQVIQELEAIFNVLLD